ncbi:MAG: dimethyl sulfoxide reductase anchor subunit [Alphaproteobacteria bacterium]|nr:dimethyl sulfoxide reductase anchor subunit [Alphaproteobacteria bacterium]
MHPAYSVIFFTSASGAGYGLLIWLGSAELFGALPDHWWFRFLGFGIALALITAGLLSSTAHLGRPERAWRAFSQWRSSWLSREGVAAVVTYVPAGLFALAAIFGLFEGAIGFWAILTIAGALVTVWCTAMIYASLTTIRAWNDQLVPPLYIALSLTTGGLLYCGLASLMIGVGQAAIWGTLVALVVGWLLKTLYWSRLDGRKLTLTPGDALGLAKHGRVRTLEAPHSQANFVMREMGYTIGRRHAERIRIYAVTALFVVPALCCLALLALPSGLAPLFGVLGVLSAGAGILAERWLFFAEAQHIVSLYYGAEAA